MGDPKDHVVAVAPKKGQTCYLCGQPLDTQPGIQIQVQMPLVKFKTIMQRGCLQCAEKLLELLQMRIAQAKKGEFQS